MAVNFRGPVLLVFHRVVKGTAICYPFQIPYICDNFFLQTEADVREIELFQVYWLDRTEKSCRELRSHM